MKRVLAALALAMGATVAFAQATPVGTASLAIVHAMGGVP